MYKNLYIDQASAFTQRIQVLTEDGMEFRNLTGLTLIGSMKKSRDSLTEIPFAITVVDPINGIFDLYLDSTQTASLDPSRYYIYDVIIDSDLPVRLVSGNGYVSFAVTLPGNVPTVMVPVQKFSIDGYPVTTTADPTDYVLLSKPTGMYKIKVSDLLGN